MAFIKETDFIIKKQSTNEFAKITAKNGLIVYFLDNNLNKTNSLNIIDGNYSYLDFYFDIDSNDNIYGIVNDKYGKVLIFNLEGNNLTKEISFKYDYNNFCIKCPFIKHFEDSTHIIYMSIDYNFSNQAKLIHIFKSQDTYFKNIITTFNYNILNNYISIFNDKNLILFYFNLVDEVEELFISIFDLCNLKWSKPLQITHSKLSKIYLSVIKSYNNEYHICFSEKHNNKYNCFYLNLSIQNDTFKINSNTVVLTNTMCLFPSLIQFNSNLYIEFVEYHDLFYCKSFDNGKTFSEPKIYSKISNAPFLRYEYKENTDNIFSISSIFLDENLKFLDENINF